LGTLRHNRLGYTDEFQPNDPEIDPSWPIKIVSGAGYFVAMKKSRISFRTAACPSCGAKGSLRRIIWGMPSADLDFDKYAVGGCCIPENPHEIACSECAWSGWRGSLVPPERIIRTEN